MRNNHIESFIYCPPVEVIETVKKDVIGVWMLTNTITVQLLEIRYAIEDTALIKYENELLECTIQYSVEDDYNYIEVGALHLPFDECIRYD